jgi:hypothetical protein
MKRLWVVLWIMLIGVGVVGSAVPDYLRAASTDISPSVSARIGQPVAANMVLKRVGIVPEEARLNITTELEAPRIEVRVDNTTEPYALGEVEVPLPLEGVSEIEIRVNGFAPPVEKLTDIKVLDVKTFVLYKGEEEQYQDEGTLTLRISTKEITEVVFAIDDAKALLTEAEGLIDDLKAKGVNTVDLEAELVDAKEQISRAEGEHDKGDIDNAKFLAEQAKKDLKRIISKAKEMGAGPAPVDIKRYLTIAAAVIVVLIVALFLRGRREELG